MERAIREVYKKKSNSFNGVVYRAAFISKSEFERLERNEGQEIEAYSFLSTSKSFKAATKFLKYREKKKAFMTIIIPPLPEFDEQGFADLSNLSAFINEEEIVLNMMSRFQILQGGTILIQIQGEEIEHKHLVVLYAPQVLKRYMAKNKPSISFEFDLSREFECSQCQCRSQNDLFAFRAEELQIKCKKCLIKDSIPKNTLLLPIHEKSQKLEKRLFKGKVRGMLLKYDEEVKFPYYGYKCDDCEEKGKTSYYKWINYETGDATSQCSDCFEKKKEIKSGCLLLAEKNPYTLWQQEEEEWDTSIGDLKPQESEKLRDMSQSDVFLKTESFDKCIQFCETMLKKLARKKGREKEKVRYYVNLGRSNEYLGRKSQLSTERLKFYDKAFEYFHKTRNILKIMKGENHTCLIAPYRNLATAHANLEQYKEARRYLEMILHIRKALFGEKHINIVAPLNDLAFLSDKLKEHTIALEFNSQALKVFEEICVSRHPFIATLYHNLAIGYLGLEKNEEAIENQKQSLWILISIYGVRHNLTATSYYNLGLINEQLKRMKPAIENYSKALKIWESIFGKQSRRVIDFRKKLEQVWKAFLSPEDIKKYKEWLENSNDL